MLQIIKKPKSSPSPSKSSLVPELEGGTSFSPKDSFSEPNTDQFSQRVLIYLKSVLGYTKGTKVWMAGQKIMDLDMRAVYYANLVRDLESLDENDGELQLISEFKTYKHKPVGVREFICSQYYMGKESEVYPKVLDELIEINSGKYVEAVLTGGIGSGKTTGALYTTAYQLYLLSCMNNPHRLYGLDSASEILFIFQSINAKLAKGVDFNRFRSMIEACPYFTEHFPFNKSLESKLVFPNRIEVVPVSGTETAAIGQNVIGGVIDELNYMSVVEKSKQSVDKGTYDQAVALYNSISRRRKSRFQSAGSLPGILCLVSSKKYPGQFTDQKEQEAKSDPTIYIYDKRVWEIKPEGSFGPERFRVFVGDMSRKPRMLKEGEKVDDTDRKLVTEVPLEFKVDFEKDIINSLREIAGISTLARYPYFLEVDRVAACFGHHKSIFVQDKVDFVESRLTVLKSSFIKPELPRFAHVDLAISGDSAGLVIGCVTGFMTLADMGLGSSDNDFMPIMQIDGILEVAPPKNAEIAMWKIRETISVLKRLGLNIRWVTFDSFQSKDSQQLLRQQGFVVGEQSMDILPCRPYDFLKSAMYSGRVKMPEHKHCQHEIVTLERDSKTGKIDHLPGGSKDCADALAGVVFGLTMRREIWSYYGVSPVNVPNNIYVNDRLENNDERLRNSSVLSTEVV